ncbi:SsgA family sporulation/cell division regulator [Streptomyces sp. Da 82-17]|uniref:SsgA family sporulation/cell division regulator n=1 Tax=Streptomyces sp. Da 82-17 TaxID=3377116 RepID=UPI0038D501DD
MAVTLQQPTRARLVTPGERECTVPATLRYVASDPLALHIAFPAEASVDGSDVTWTFARQLLDQGLRVPAGTGDVHIWPCGRARTVVEFHSPYGLALVQFDRAVLERFLLRTYAVVAAGREEVGRELDRGLEQLLRGV